jgi:gas vesicle protein
MSRDDNKAGGKLALGALIGGLAGYLTGVLTAPKSGKQTRTDIANKAEAVKDGAESQLQDAVDELNGTMADLKSKTLALSAKAREEYDETLIKAKDAQNKAAQVLKAVKAGEASDPELNKAVKQARQAAKNLARYLKS